MRVGFRFWVEVKVKVRVRIRAGLELKKSMVNLVDI